jgi:cysteine desulfurase/selenocysteine lyase
MGLGAAIDYLRRIGLENIRNHEEALLAHMMKRLSEVKGLRVFGPGDIRKRASLAAFAIEGVHPHDVSAMLAEDGICVRSGHHCAMPVHEKLGIPATTRASVYLYNRKEEIDALAESLLKIRKVFG